MRNFLLALFGRTPPAADDSEVSRLQRMRARAGGAQAEVKELKNIIANNGNMSDSARITVGRGQTEQSQAVQQKWIDDCGFSKPKHVNLKQAK